MEVDATISVRTLTLSVESWARSPSHDVMQERTVVTAQVRSHQRGEFVSRIAVLNNNRGGPIAHGADLADSGGVVEGLDYDSHRESIFDGLLGDVIASPETERDKDDSGRYREAQSGVA